MCVHVLRAWCPLLDPYITIGVSMMRGMLAGELPVPEDHSYATVTMECASVLECCGHPRFLFTTFCAGMSVYVGKKFIAPAICITSIKLDFEMKKGYTGKKKCGPGDCSDIHCRCSCQRGFVPAQAFNSCPCHVTVVGEIPHPLLQQKSTALFTSISLC